MVGIGKGGGLVKWIGSFCVFFLKLKLIWFRDDE